MSAADKFREVVPADRVSEQEDVRREHAHDYWALEAIHDFGNTPAAPPPCVVHPQSTDEVSAILRVADRERIAVVPYGLGSGVCGGVLPGADAVVVDMSRMDTIIDVNGEALTARVQAGRRGSEFEEALQAQNFTMGHFPQSIAVSTVGGWVATRASGQLSTRYGNIEDLLLAVEVVLPGGKVMRTFPAPRAATGPDLRQLILGSEGTLGIVTELEVKIAPKAQWTDGFAAKLPRWEDGLEITRELLQAGWRPAVMRLYDGIEAYRNFGKWLPEEQPTILLMSEGTEAMSGALELEIEAARNACTSRGGELLGREPLDHWLGHRNSVPSWDDLLQGGVVVDTIEVSATWDRVGPMYGKVTEAMKGVEGMLAVSGHTSHGYTTGVNIYFTFIGGASEAPEQERIYKEAWAAAMEATIACGGSIAHHHGIGRIRREYLPREVGDTGMDVLRAVKKAVDPNGIMNPGALLT